MKNITKLLFLIIINSVFAQVEDTGNKVGIGVANPLSKLHVFNGISGGTPHVFSDMTIEDSDDGMVSILTPSNKTAYFGFADQDDSYVGGMQYEHNNDRLIFRVNNHLNNMTISSQGNIGIGSSTPSEKLHLEGNLLLDVYNKGNDNGIFFREGFNLSNKYNLSILAYDHSNSGATPDGLSINAYDGISFSTGSNTRSEKMRISLNGNVGIGTTDTKGFKLGVQGKIAAEEVKVATYANWADFVFEDNYNLPSLKEVESHIKEKGHLKDIPSAEEVEKHGIFLGEMDSKLLQKIEELTLYIIQQQKEINALEAKTLKANILEKELQNQKVINKQLKEQLDKQNTRLLKIETLLNSKKQ
ncbi:hypothetical protein [Flavivirga eckloniae]|uniref:Peptidase S74 domain-containing protein n=1 Tax=Flavivirga eckloniae TaxID=1803846 RepID=A0A2K9PRM3_9FLAO|nr:hypothetical protein [Flavivirga eckloniae]AUP79695.1 hypothetical protein C1H87_13650 [Flavivirga eckloniae]